MLNDAPIIYRAAINELTERARVCSKALGHKDEKRVSRILFKDDRDKISSLENGGWVSDDVFNHAVNELAKLEEKVGVRLEAANATS